MHWCLHAARCSVMHKAWMYIYLIERSAGLQASASCIVQLIPLLLQPSGRLSMQFDCCGGTGLADYTSQNVLIPDSCCINDNHPVGCGASQNVSVFHTQVRTQSPWRLATCRSTLLSDKTWFVDIAVEVCDVSSAAVFRLSIFVNFVSCAKMVMGASACLHANDLSHSSVHLSLQSS